MKNNVETVDTKEVIVDPIKFYIRHREKNKQTEIWSIEVSFLTSPVKKFRQKETRLRNFYY